MPRKPNYGLERAQRRAAKEEKKAARLQARADKSDARKSDPDEPGASDDLEQS